MTQAPLTWVRTLQAALIDAQAIPLSGFPPAFPWEAFTEKCAEILGQPELKLSCRGIQFLKNAEITSGFGSGYIPIALELTPLNGQALWILGREEISKLTTLALLASGGNKGFSSSQFQEGFYHYLATQMLEALNRLDPLDELAIKLGKPGTLSQEESLCMDIEIQLPKLTCFGRLICPAALHTEFKNYFRSERPPALTGEFAKQMQVALRLEVGHTTLPLSVWQKVRVGDFILLDRCSLNPQTHKGHATLMLGQTPLLHVKMKESGLKIVDYAIYREELHPMYADIPEDENTPKRDDLSSAEVESEEENSAEMAAEEDESEPSHLWSESDTDVEKLISVKEVPLTLSIEIARLQMSLDKLLQLTPGNVLELQVRAEQGVNIIIGGKKVARAELIKLGEMLGVKILQLGD